MGDELMDAPNQQTVRPDGSAPWEEGNGGTPADPKADEEVDPSSMTKAQLLELADERNVEADDSMTKAQIIEALEA